MPFADSFSFTPNSCIIVKASCHLLNAEDSDLRYGRHGLMNKGSLSFVVYMIHRCANQWGLPPARVYRMLKESGCIQTYLVPHYDVLHTQSSGYVLNDIQQYLQKREIMP